MIGLPYGEKKYDDMLSRFHLIPERYGQTDRRTDRQTDRFAISISHISMLTRDIDIANLSVCPSVRNVPVSDENGLTYRHIFFTTR